MFRAIVTLVVSALVLMLCGWIVPGFVVFGFWGAVKTAIVIALLGFVVERFFGRTMSPRGRGTVSFVIAAVIIYLSQYVVPSSVEVSFIGALIASLVIGLIDGFVPTHLR